jgi:hypothetical protein
MERGLAIMKLTPTLNDILLPKVRWGRERASCTSSPRRRLLALIVSARDVALFIFSVTSLTLFSSSDRLFSVSEQALFSDVLSSCATVVS